MQTELTNLLPPERLVTLKREYFLRLATTAIAALAAVVIGSGALLIPSYLYLGQEIQARQNRLAELDTQLAATGGKETNARLAALTDNVSYLARLASSSSATAALRGVLAAPRPGITLTAVIFDPAKQKADGKMTLKGTAATRQTLRAYVDVLSALPFVSNADLPISAYAKETSIPFVITLTGTLAP
jgi:Tfp pilus assembly protein PilN